MNHVTVVLQTELMLSGPSNYWISVINAGRYFKLDTVSKALGDPVEVCSHIVSAGCKQRCTD